MSAQFCVLPSGQSSHSFCSVVDVHYGLEAVRSLCACEEKVPYLRLPHPRTGMNEFFRIRGH